MVLKLGVIGFVIFLIACSTSKKTTTTTLTTSGKTDNLAGLEIVKQSDCVTCHSTEKKLVGPSFSAVAGKYDLTAENIDKLSKKIISGGNGAWGEIIMTPHPSLSGDDAKAVVKYILLLKKQTP